MSAPSPLSGNVDQAVFAIFSNGKEINKESGKLVSLEITQEINRIPTASLQFNDGTPAKQSFDISESEDLMPGKEIEVKVGYGLKPDTTIFKGVVVRHELGASQGGSPFLKVECKDHAIKLTKAHSFISTQKAKDSDVVSTMISNAGLSADVDSTEPELPVLIQTNATDWDFMLMRATVNGFVVIPDAGKVGFKKIKTDQSPVLSLTFGKDIISFQAGIYADHQYSSVKASSWDFPNQEVVSVESSPKNPLSVEASEDTSSLSSITGSDPYVMPTSATVDQQLLQIWADATMLRSELTRTKGQFKFKGNAKVKPGTLVEIAGLNASLNGNAYVKSVKHSFPKNDWITDISIGLDIQTPSQKRASSSQAKPGSNILPPMHGIQNATVKQIAGEEDNQLKVLIELSQLESGKNEIWARLSTMYATDQAGTFFYPETGDEVVVGFVNGNPDSAVILGSLYNSNSKNPPFTPDENNTHKAIVTKNQLKITFDDEKKVIQITTPGNNQMTFSDEDGSITISDQNDNSIKMSSSGIDINSATSINISAQENINIQATANLTLAAQAEAKLNGATVTVEAEAELTAQGAMTKLAGSGITTIQGGIVNIN
ncbi:MAG: type VI secretion system tip protein VgrG [Bacteroidota bacterium]